MASGCPRRMRSGIVLGAGGLPGEAFHRGTLAAVEEAWDLDARCADVLVDTSAGAITLAGLRLLGESSPPRWCRPEGGRRSGHLPGLSWLNWDRPGDLPLAVTPELRGLAAALLPAGRNDTDILTTRLERRFAGRAPAFLGRGRPTAGRSAGSGPDRRGRVRGRFRPQRHERRCTDREGLDPGGDKRPDGCAPGPGARRWSTCRCGPYGAPCSGGRCAPCAARASGSWWSNRSVRCSRSRQSDERLPHRRDRGTRLRADARRAGSPPLEPFVA